MTDLRNFIEERMKAVEADLAEIRPRIAPLEAELKELKRAHAALSGSQYARRRSPPSEGSIQDQALQVLRSAPKGLTATQVQSQIEERFGRKLDRTTLSPQLSRLRRSGLAHYCDGAYALPLDKEAADANR